MFITRLASNEIFSPSNKIHREVGRAPMLRRPLGRPKNRWEDDIRNNIKKLKIKNGTNCIQGRKNWKLYVEKAETFKELKL
jgi:hypothetical protein